MNYYSMKGEDTELDIYDNLEIESNSEIGKWHCSVLSIFKKSQKKGQKIHVVGRIMTPSKISTT